MRVRILLIPIPLLISCERGQTQIGGEELQDARPRAVAAEAVAGATTGLQLDLPAPEAEAVPEAAAQTLHPFEIRETTGYETGPMGGWYGVLFLRGAYVDTVDILSVYSLGGDSILYLPVRLWVDPDHPELGVWGMTTKYTVFDGERYGLLEEIVPYLDNTFSSPTVIGKHIYYWGIRKTAEGYQFYANRFEPQTGRVESVHLMDDLIETDNIDHFRPPVETAAGIRYSTFRREWILDRAHRIVAPG